MLTYFTSCQICNTNAIYLKKLGVPRIPAHLIGVQLSNIFGMAVGFSVHAINIVAMHNIGVKIDIPSATPLAIVSSVAVPLFLDFLVKLLEA